MVQQGSGHIFNIGSIAGKEVYPKGNIYCATKHAVDALTRGMRIDLVDKNIRVTQVSPGAVETEFSMVRFKGDKEKAKRIYEGYEPLVAENIADIIFYISSLPENINVNDIVVTAKAQANSYIVNRQR
jgi:NADP-dependent 3-hydroxy acid dehydrogenase YdfG